MPDRTFSWLEIVTAADGPDRHRNSLYPVVYTFGNNRTFRDSGKGPYEPTAPTPTTNPPTAIDLSSLTFLGSHLGAVVGTVTVTDADLPNDVHTFGLSDPRFEIVVDVLKLKDDQQVVGEPFVAVSITATDQTGHAFTQPFILTLTYAPTDILIDPLLVQEKTLGAVIGIVTVVDADLPNDSFTFTFSDARFEIVDGVFKLKSGDQLIFADEPSVSLAITAIDQNTNPFPKGFTITVSEQTVPVTNHAPTDVLLAGTLVSDTELGAIVGTVTGVDPDLPNDTLVLTVDDPRFVIIPLTNSTGQLRLKPNKFLSHLLEPTVHVTLTATDAGGLSTSHVHTLQVTDIPAPSLANAVFVGPASAGLGNGTSFANRYGFTSINTAIATAAAAVPKKQVLLGTQFGNYTAALVIITHGGAAGEPVIVRGCNDVGDEASILLVGTRTDPWVTGGTNGSEVFRLLGGANHLIFKNIDAHNIGNGLFKFGDMVTDYTIDTCNVANCQRFIENVVAGTAVDATATNVRVRNCLAEGYSRAFARVSYTSNGWSFENDVGDSMSQQDGTSFPSGLTIEGSAHHITVTGCTMRNSRDIVRHQPSPPGDNGFQNGDGYSTEAANHDIAFVNSTASGNTDAGFDCKSPVSFVGCRSWDNRALWKLWGVATLLDCHGYDVNRRGNAPQGCFMIEIDHTTAAGNADVTITDSTFVDNDPATIVFGFDDPTKTHHLTTINTSVQKHASAALTFNTSATATMTLDTKTPPTFSDVPVLSAIANAGETCTVTPATSPTGVTNAFQWLRSGAYIDDAVSPGYIATAAEVGFTLSCRQFTVDVNGYMAEITSAESAVIAAVVPVNLTLPVIIGPPVVGAVLTKVPGTYSGLPAPTLGSAWRSNGAVNGQTQTNYLVMPGDLGKMIDVVEPATNAAGQIFTVSVAVGPVLASLDTAYVRLVSHGAANGSSWANALPGSAIGNTLPGLTPGGIVYLRADEGEYDLTKIPNLITISAGGTAVDPIVTMGVDEDGNPVPFHNAGATSYPTTIQGVLEDLTPSLATITKNRTSWTRPYEGNVTNPFTTQAGSAVVNCHVPSHNMRNNTGTQVVQFRGQSAVGGATILTTGYVATMVDDDNFTITLTNPASSDGGPGGGTCAFEASVRVNSWTVGNEAIRLANGANNIKLSYLKFKNCGNAVNITSGALLTNIEVDHCEFFNVQRFLELQPTGRVTNHYIHDCNGVGHSKQAIRWRNSSSLLVCEDTVIECGRQDGDNFPNGIEHDTGAHDTAVRRCTFSNMHDSTNAFWNGDGISGEYSNYNVLIEDTEVFGCTDAGIDHKTTNLILRRVHSHHNKNGVKVWTKARITVDECLLEDPFSRGGSGSSQCVELSGNTTPVSDPGMDIRIKSTTFRFNGAAGVAILAATPEQNHNIICRQLENTFTNIIAGTDQVTEPANLNIAGVLADVTGPVISTAATFNVHSTDLLQVALTADEDCSWSIAGGDDPTLFSIRTAAGVACQIGENLWMERQTFSGVDDVRSVKIRAEDAKGNTTDKTITVTILSTLPTPVFSCDFNGANGATTATDDATGKTITFAGNAQLSTLAPMEGVSSLLLDGAGDYTTTPTSADFRFTGQFSIKVKFRAAALVSSAIISYYTSSSNNRSWRLDTLNTGDLLFLYSTDGSATTGIQTTGIGLVIGTDYELAVTRDELGKQRMFLNGVMVGSLVAGGGALFDATATMRIGTTTSGAPTYFNGRVDKVRIWKDFCFCATDAGYTP